MGACKKIMTTNTTTINNINEINEKIASLTVGRTEVHSLGGGEWSIEAYDLDGYFMREFVGENGTNSLYSPDGKGDDLWEELRLWDETELAPRRRELEAKKAEFLGGRR